MTSDLAATIPPRAAELRPHCQLLLLVLETSGPSSDSFSPSPVIGFALFDGALGCTGEGNDSASVPVMRDSRSLSIWREIRQGET